MSRSCRSSPPWRLHGCSGTVLRDLWWCLLRRLWIVYQAGYRL